ncbi:hypothetical protein Q7P37_004457 [Cladosporium fusiforme]
MFRTSLLAATTLAAAANALHFQLSPFRAQDIRIPSESHSVSFTVSAPENVYEQGGSDPADCTLAWSDKVPTCFQRCGDNSGYYARVTPGSYEFAGNFSVDIWQAYVYEIGNHNNATVVLEEGEESFGCSRGGQSTICELREEELEVEEEQYFGGADPAEVCSA